MITDSFDPLSPPLFTAEDMTSPLPEAIDRCIITFSQDVLSHALTAYQPSQVGTMNMLNGPRPVYRLVHLGHAIALAMSPITSAGAGNFVAQLQALVGFSKLLCFGSCGALSSQLQEGHLILPTRAYRDEGFSYHYAKAADYIEVSNAGRMAAWLDALGLPYTAGPVWTTDGLFRETRNNFLQRQAEGCIAVDMECSGLQAYCDFQGLEYYTFFYTGDQLDAPQWDARILGNQEELDHQLSGLRLAMRLISRA